MDRQTPNPYSYQYQQPYQQTYQQPQQPQYQQQTQPMMGVQMMNTTQQPVYQQQTQQQPFYQMYQQPMQSNVTPQYIQDQSYRSNVYKNMMMQQTPMYQQMPQYTQYMQQPMFQQQQPKKKFNPYDYEEDEEIVEDEPSSEEAEFTYSSGESEEEDITQEMLENYQRNAPLPAVRRTAGRIHRNERKFSSETSEIEEEEEFFEAKGPVVEEAKLEHIFVSRIGKEGIEYLVRFQDAKDCLCQWEPESLLCCLDNASSHLARFKQDPIDISGDNGVQFEIVPISFRNDNNAKELLYRFTFDQTVLLFWDEVDDETFDKFLQARRKIDLADPEKPIGDLVEPTVDIIKSKSGSTLRDYQLSGLKWLIQCWRDGHGSVLADEMGLGKTIQVLAFLTYLNKYTEFHGPFLITVRTNTFKQWCDEIEKWTDLSYIPYSSGPQQRKIIREFQFPYLDDSGNPILDESGKPKSLSFNILLVSYDVFLKDIEFLSTMKWECLVVDEGHRIKNSEGKKNNAMKNLNASHRIILTGTPVQNTLQELWTLLNFVSPEEFEENPDFLQGDIESLEQDKLEELKKKIHPHLLRRTLAEAERTIAPKEEKIAFVSLTDVQRELIRLIQLHSMWRLKGIQIDESTVDTSHESASIQKVCCHPFLIEGAEEYYTKRLNLSRIDLLRNLSSKFIWISKILEELKRDNHKVLIFSQKVQLLHILREFCILSGYNTELLIGEMSDLEKSAAIENYSTNKDSFVFLISTRAGSEGLNLTVADTAIIFDPDWNPQNDLQAQARVHRIGQKQKVDVIRLITYQTYEHEMFVRAQKKLGLWMDLLGEDNSADNSPADRTPVDPPPRLQFDMPIDPSAPLLPQLSTVLNGYSMSSLPRLEATLDPDVDYTDGVSEEDFLARFPVIADEFVKTRVKRSRSYDSIDNARAKEIMEEIRYLGYGKWDKLAERFKDHSSGQLENFTISLIILCFRALPPMEMSHFPFLLKLLRRDVPDFSLDMLVCTRKGKWLQAVNEEHEFYIEINACKSLKEIIYDSGYDFLMAIEVKLIANTWLSFNSIESFDFERVPPPYLKTDQECLQAMCADRADIDQYDERVSAIAGVMKQDIIKASRTFAAMQLDFWTGPELDAVLYMMKNFTFSLDDAIQLHMKTGLISKKTEQVVDFVKYLYTVLSRRTKKFPVILPPNVTFFDHAPIELQTSKVAHTWTQIQKREYTDVSDRILILRTLQIRESRIAPFSETTTWSNFHTKKLFQYLLIFGLDAMPAILLDKKIGLVRVLSKFDRRFVQGKMKKRIREPNSPEDFALSIEALCNFLKSSDNCDDFFERARNQSYEYIQPGQVLDNYDSSSSDEEMVQLPDDEPIIDTTPQIQTIIQQPQTMQTIISQPTLMTQSMGQPLFYSNLMMNPMQQMQTQTLQQQQMMRKPKRHDDDYTFDGPLLDDE